MFAVAGLAALHAVPGLAQIENYKLGQTIPGTQGITPGPGVDLSGWNSPGHELEYAYLIDTDLTGATFANSDLSFADFFGSTLTNVNFTGAIIQSAELRLNPTLTLGQLYSTASYADGYLGAINVQSDDLIGANFSNQNLTGAIFTNAQITNANFTGAVVNGATFSSLSANQLTSTASYATGNLAGINLEAGEPLTGFNFNNQNLTNAILDGYIVGATFAGANVTGASFGRYFTTSQLFSTASYVNGDLSGCTFGIDLTGCNLANQNLTNANFSQAILTNANFEGAIITGANFGVSPTPLTASQLYSTASYANGDLVGIGLGDDDLTGWNFAGQNLSKAVFNVPNSNPTTANLTNANFSDADLRGATDWVPVSSTITHDAIQPKGSIQGLSLEANETLIIRNNPIAITVETSATFDPASTLQFQLASNWTSPISFAAGLTPELNGTLDLEIAPGVDPATLVGDTFQLFDWNTPLPAGDQFSMITTDPSLNWDLSDLYTTGAVSVSAVPEPAAITLLGVGAMTLLARRRRQP